MGDIVDSVFGGLLGGKSPKVNTGPAVGALTETLKKNKKSRAQALSTIGGVAGEELSASQVSKQGTTLFGN